MTAWVDGFPRDDYTPHGYLANPYAFARSWSDGQGGNLRSTEGAVGFGWLYPWARGARAGAQLELGIASADRRLLSRADFELAGLSAPHHSALLFEYAWELRGLECRARFVLLGEDELGMEVEVGEGPSRGEGSDDGHALTLYVAVAGWRSDGVVVTAEADDGVGSVDLKDPFGPHQLIVEGPAGFLGAAAGLGELVERGDGSERLQGERVAIRVAIPLEVANGRPARAYAILRRVASPAVDRPVGDAVRAAVEEARRRDDGFWREAARLAGDWPPSWRRGWVYDLETTRMCIFPPGGIFSDVWPAWTIQWPRAVLAEGSLDVLRLAYGDPKLAKRAALSLFRDAPAPNVPCIFRHGEPNMVAADGSVCGTSPAWCVPFYNLEHLYLATLDRAWLAELYPYLSRYLEWWLTERTDSEGWAVYKCTWEAGEDDTPRLDPERRGDNVVSEYVRPVELQATMALSAAVLARFAEQLGWPDESARWRALSETFAERTGALWDAASGRFRDWDRRGGRFLEPSRRPNYWGIDPCRYSALAFTPLLAGLATSEQTRALARELEEYATPPWTLWPSWSYVVLEAALAAGERRFAARVAADIVHRVYGELDRRQLGEPRGPTSGVAREYWPLDLDAWDACEGYGWGATTASFVVRQIFGFLESDVPEGLRFRLAPALPEPFLEPGRRYALANVPYRGESLDLEYTVRSEPRGALEARVGTTRSTTCVVADERGIPRYEGRAASETHQFTVEIDGLYGVELRPHS